MEITPFINFQENPPPKDGTFVILLVKADHENWQPTEDSEIFRTIGFNDFDENGDNDTWRCVGWDWCQDMIIETTGEILAWMPLPEIPKVFLENNDSEKT
jgi:hypothetical protein